MSWLAAGKDPVEFRRHLLAKSPRLLGVLELAAEKAGWGKPLPAGHARGVRWSTTSAATTRRWPRYRWIKGKLRVHHVVCAVDCGQSSTRPARAADPKRHRLWFDAALKGAITIDRGRVQQANFNHYDVLRIDEMPVVEVHIVPSRAAPGGIGEASTPTIIPAVANAIFAATGKRLRKLPIRPEDLA